MPWTRACDRDPRRGFTIVELLVAMMLAGAGLLALAGTGALVAREVGSTRSSTAAALIARNRLESFASAACAAPAGSGVDVLHGVRGDWSTWREGALELLRDSVSWRDARGAHAVVVRSARPC